MADPPHILIAGAGYAGLAAYLALRPALERGEVAVTLVNADDHHLLLPELPLYLSGESGEEQVRLHLRDAVRPPARVEVATVEAVEPDGPALICPAPAGRLQGDGLLVCLGSVSDDFGVPGVAEHTTPIGRWDDMRQLRQRLLADLHGRGATSVAVVGGGFTGVEVATELADRAREVGSGLRLQLIAPHVLQGMPEAVRAQAADALRALGVRQVQGRAEAVEAGRVRLAGGESVEAGLIVWAAGVRANPAVAHCGLPVNRRGQVRADDRLRGGPHLYLAGDCVEVQDPRTGRPVPPTAQAALQEGPAAARNLLRELRGEATVAFAPKDRGVLISLGHDQAAGRIGHLNVHGGDVAALKRLIEAYHAFQVGGLRTLARRLVRGVRGGGAAGKGRRGAAAGAGETGGR